jgi:hypothetical protein
MVMGPARLGPVCDCTAANYIPVLSSERTPHFNNKAIRLKKRKGESSSWAPKQGPTLRQIGQLTVDRKIDVDYNADDNKAYSMTGISSC